MSLSPSEMKSCVRPWFYDLLALKDCRAFMCGEYCIQASVAEEMLGGETRCKWSCGWTGDGPWYNQ